MDKIYINDNVNWYDVKELPPIAELSFYGKRFSIAVVCGNCKTKKVWKAALRWDYQNKFWCDYSFKDGIDVEDMDIFEITHWMYYPSMN